MLSNVGSWCTYTFNSQLAHASAVLHSHEELYNNFYKEIASGPRSETLERYDGEKSEQS